MGSSGSKTVEAPEKSKARPIAGNNIRGDSSTIQIIAKYTKELETQQKKCEHLEALAEKEKVRAFALRDRKDKTGMESAMGRYKTKIGQRNIVVAGMNKVQEMLDALETTQLTNGTLNAVSDITGTVNQNKVSEEDAQNIIDNASEAMDEVDVINNIITQDMGNGAEISAEEQEAWFSEMEGTLPGKQQPASTVFTGSRTELNGAVNTNVANLPMAPLPNVPTNAVQMSDEDREMAELAAEMGM